MCATIGVLGIIGLGSIAAANLFRNVGDFAEANKYTPVFIINIGMAFFCFFWMWGHIEKVHPDTSFLGQFLCSVVAGIFGLTMGIVLLAIMILGWIMGLDMS